MPITQDRLINLIEIADEALSWCKAIKAVIDADADLTLATLNSALSSDDIERKNIAIKIGHNYVCQSLNATADIPFPLHLFERLAAERAHFHLTKRRNEIKREIARDSRKRAREELSAEIDAAMAQKLRQVAKSPVAKTNADSAAGADGTDLTPASPIEVGKPVF